MTSFTQSLANFYRGKRVLVTGHTGLKGAWLALWLERLGATVHGVALAPRTQDSIFVAAALQTEGAVLDVLDLPGLRARFESFRPDIVFHLAAQALVGPAYEQPLDTFATNVMGSLHVLECIRSTPGVAAAVMITSDKCYENVEQIWGYREYDRLGGQDPYSASKGAAEIAISAYVRSYFANTDTTNIATARAGNVVGGGDYSPLRLVPDCIRALRTNTPIRIRNPQATRPWQFVLEPLGGYLLLGMRLAERGNTFEGGWNFGPSVDNTTTVLRGAHCIVETWGRGEVVVEPNDTFHESTLLQLDCTKARRELGWRAVYDFEETMRQTSLWYKAQHAEGGTPDMRAFSLSQLAEFEARLDRELGSTP